MYKKLRLVNFLSHKETTLDFTVGSPLLLLGHNGSGKSSVLDAITLCLFRRARNVDARRSGVDNLIHYNEPYLELQLDFSLLGDDYSLHFYKKRDETPVHELCHQSVFYSGESCLKFIKNLLRVDYDLFTSSVFLVQGSSDAFFLHRVEDRKRMLERVIGYDILRRAHEKSQELKRDMQLEYKKCCEVYSYVEKLLEKTKHEKSFFNYELLLDKEKKLREKLETLTNRERVLMSRLSALDELDRLRKEYTRISNEINELESYIRVERHKLNELRLKVKCSRDEVTSLEDSLNRVSFEQLKSRLSYLRSKLEKKQERLSTLEQSSKIFQERKRKLSNASGVCPTCGVELVEADRRYLLEVVNQQLAENDLRLTKLRFYVRRFSQAYNTLFRYIENFKNAQKSLQYKLEILKNLETSCQEKVELLEKSFRRYKKLQEESAIQKAKIKLLDYSSVESEKRELEELQKQKSQLQKEQEDVLAQKIRYEELEKRLSTCQKELNDSGRKRNELEKEVWVRDQVVKVFSEKGFASFMIERSIEGLKAIVNETLSVLSDQMSLEFVFDSQKGRTFDVSVMKDGYERPYQLLSSGERYCIDLAMRVGLSRFLLARSGVMLKSLFIDEGMGRLDTVGIDKFVELIYRLSSKNWFEQIVIITHLPELKEYYSNRIELAKIGESSRIIS